MHCKSAQFQYAETTEEIDQDDAEPIRKTYEVDTGKLDMLLAKHAATYANRSQGFAKVFPKIFKTLQERDNITITGPSTKQHPEGDAAADNSGIQAMVIMTIMANMNLEDMTATAAQELVPFFEELKKDANWAHGLHAFGTVLLGIQDHKVSIAVVCIAAAFCAPLTFCVVAVRTRYGTNPHNFPERKAV